MNMTLPPPARTKSVGVGRRERARTYDAIGYCIFWVLNQLPEDGAREGRRCKMAPPVQTSSDQASAFPWLGHALLLLKRIRASFAFVIVVVRMEGWDGMDGWEVYTM